MEDIVAILGVLGLFALNAIRHHLKRIADVQEKAAK
jgi:hypothetical protein